MSFIPDLDNVKEFAFANNVTLPSGDEPFAQVSQMIASSIGNLLPISFYWIDTEGYVHGCNMKVVKDLGYNSIDEIIGLHTAVVASPLAWENSKEVMVTKQTLVREEVYEPVPEDESQNIYYLSVKSPMLDSTGVVIGLLGISVDISEFKRQDALVISEKNARERAALMELLSASIAHELRTPLAGIGLGVNGLKAVLPALLESYALSRDQGLAVPAISPRKLTALEELLANLELQSAVATMSIDLLLANINKGSIDPDSFARCQLSECVQHALMEYPFIAEQSKLVHQDLREDFAFFGSERHLVLVMFNLLKNALYYIEAAQKGEIYISCQHDDECGYLIFKDTSQGIPANEIEFIFDNFFSKRFGGSGVGLAFCKTVMQSFNGTISCRSVLNEYTEFTLTFSLCP